MIYGKPLGGQTPNVIRNDNISDTKAADAFRSGAMWQKAQKTPKKKSMYVNPSKIKQVKNPFLQNQAESIAGMSQQIQNAPMTQIAQAPQEQFRGQQMQLAQLLQQQATGQGPSLAAAQMQQAQDALIKQQQAQTLSMQGVNPALAMRGLQQQGALQGQQLVQNVGALRLQEQQQAQQQLASVLAGARGTDVTLAGQQAALTSEEQQFRDQMAADLMKTGFSLEQAQQMASQQIAQFNAQQKLGRYQADKGVSGQQNGAMMSAAGAGLAALITAMSDANQKEEIKDTSPKDMSAFLDALEAKNYKYKDTKLPGTAEGKRFGILAQDLEKSKIGKSIVRDTEHGKMVDVSQGYGVVLAALSDINKRLKKVGG